MSLESLYTQAPTNTYVGIVRTKQSSTAPVNQSLVNFLDGQKKVAEQDEFQTEFTRNAPRSFLAGGAQGVSRSSGQTYTRWTNKSFNLAFGNEGPSQLINGFYTNQFRTSVGPKGSVTVHNYTPNSGQRFRDMNASANTRINASPSGAPTGL